MSDDIRIYGGGGQGPGGDPRRRRAEALTRFKRGHKGGDLVTGVFLRLEPVQPGTAWVSLEGAALLAALPEELADLARRIAAGQGAGATPTGVTEANFPIQRGQACYFIVEALEPEPVLRMLGVTDPKALGRSAAEARWQGVLRLPLTQLAARYTQKRSRLELELRQRLWSEADLALPFPSELPPSLTDFSAAAFAEEQPDPAGTQGRYFAFIREPERRDDYAELELYRAALVENLRGSGLLGFFFVPWLCPAAHSLELAFIRERSGEAQAPDRASAMQRVSYSLQGLFEDAREQTRCELSGLVGGRRVRRVPGPDEPDLLRRLLTLRPDEARPVFRRKA